MAVRVEIWLLAVDINIGMKNKHKTPEVTSLAVYCVGLMMWKSLIWIFLCRFSLSL